jgi:hypothetical protein
MKTFKQQAEVIQNENDHIHSMGQGKARHRYYKKFKLQGSQAVEVIKLLS